MSIFETYRQRLYPTNEFVGIRRSNFSIKKSISEASEKLLLDIKTDSKTCRAIVGILTADYSPGLPDELQWKIAVYRYMQKTYGTDFMDRRIAEAIKEEKIIKENM